MLEEEEIDQPTGRRHKEASDAEILAQVEAQEELVHKTHTHIDPSYVGNIESLSRGQCVVSFLTTEWMAADHEGMIHPGFISMGAEHTAISAINEPNAILMHMDSNFFAPVRVDEEIRFESKVRHTDGRKREVDVIGMFNDIKVFEGRATVVITEYHPLKIDLNDVAGIK